MEEQNFHSNYISGMRIEASCGKYRLLIKIGAYCSFGIDQVSNQPHCHDCYELCIVTSGRGRFIYDQTIYPIRRGDIIMADPGILHEVQSSDPGGMHLLYVFIQITENSALTLGKLPEEVLIHDFLSAHMPQVPGKEYLLAYLEFAESYSNRKGTHTFGIRTAMRNLVLESLSALSCRAGADTGKITTQSILELALDYIDLNLKDKILIRDVATCACTSQRNLEHLFRKHLGKTVIGYINEKKMELACHYLAMHFSITDTGRLVGVPDVVQFSRLFKKHKGVSPGSYRQSKAPDKKGIGRRV